MAQENFNTVWYDNFFQLADTTIADTPIFGHENTIKTIKEVISITTHKIPQGTSRKRGTSDGTNTLWQ